MTSKRKIGQGTYGSVYSISDSECDKVFDLQNIDSFIRESYFLSYLKTIDGIVKIKSVRKEDNKYIIRMEKFGKDLSSWLKKPNKYSDRLKVIYQIIKIVCDLHHVSRVVHGDLKLENFLISNGEVKLIDFGLSGYPGSALTDYSSDIYRPAKITRSYGDDIYSLGILLTEVLLDGRMKNKLSIERIDDLLSEADKELVPASINDWKSIILPMLYDDVTIRPSMCMISSYLGMEYSVSYAPLEIVTIHNKVVIKRKELDITVKYCGEIIEKALSHDKEISLNEITKFDILYFAEALGILKCDSPNLRQSIEG